MMVATSAAACPLICPSVPLSLYPRLPFLFGVLRLLPARQTVLLDHHCHEWESLQKRSVKSPPGLSVHALLLQALSGYYGEPSWFLNAHLAWCTNMGGPPGLPLCSAAFVMHLPLEMNAREHVLGGHALYARFFCVKS